MATSKAPKHDFAPAWLKIPTQENQKWSGGKQGESGNRSVRNDDHYGNYHPYPTDYPYHPLTRQRSFDNYNDERPYSSQKFRHNSADDDYYSAAYGGYQSYNGYNYDKYGPPYRSQPSLYRRSDSKYTHPNARFTQMSGGYQSHYVPYPYDCYHGDSYYNGGGGYNGRLTGKSTNPDVRTGGARSEHKDRRSGDDKSASKDSLEEDFPSLKGEGKDTSSSPQGNAGSTGVWDKPSAKLRKSGQARHSDSAPVSPDLFGKENGSNGKQNNSIYKALVPSKSLLNRHPSRDTLKLNLGPGSRDVNSNCSSKPTTPTHTPSPPAAKNIKDFQQIVPNGGPLHTQEKEAGTAGLEILNRRFATQTRNLPDKKGQFLKILKQENSNLGLSNGTVHNAEQGYDEGMDGIVLNGVEHLSVSQEEADKLSSSLEAEQRLLKEMGWNEADDEEYEITEDDMKEFQKLTKQMKQKNGMQRSLPKTWSPQHLAVYHVDAAAELSDSMSTSSEDSDDEN